MKRLLAVAALFHAVSCLAQEVEQASTQPGPEPVTRLTLALNDVPLSQAVQVLSVRTALPLRLATERESDEKVTFSVENEPVAHAIARFLETAKLHVRPSGFSQSTITLAPGAPVRVIPVDDRSVLVLQSVVSAGTTAIRPHASEGHTHTLSGVAIFDPSVRALNAESMLRVDEVQADGAVNVRRSGGRSEQNVNGHQIAILDFSTNFGSSDRIEKLKLLKASLNVLTAKRSVTVKLESPDLRTGESAGDDQLRIDAAAGKSPAQVNLAISGTAVAAYLVPPWSDIFRCGAVRAFDRAGQPLTRLNYVIDRSDKKQIAIRIFPDPNGREEPIAELIDRIEVVVPVEAKYIDVPFVLQDFKMP